MATEYTYKRDVFALQYVDEFGEHAFKIYQNWNDVKAKIDALSLYEIFFQEPAEYKSILNDSETKVIYRFFIFNQI